MEAIPSQASHWPVNYDTAFQNSKDVRGKLHLGSVAVPPTHLVPFCNALLAQLDAIDSFKDAYFCHELRGQKGGTAHAEDEDGRNPEEAFDTFFDNVDRTRIDAGNWLVDVGLEIHDPGMVVQWSKSTHSEILKYVLPSLQHDQIDRLQNRKTFHLDHTAQMEDFAGFRCEPGLWGTQNQVEYINVYTTDKSSTYQLHSGVWRRRSCEDLHPKTLDKLLADLVKMSTTYKFCSGSQGDTPQEGCARLEIRVPLMDAQTSLRDPPLEDLKQWTYSVPTDLWWYVFQSADAYKGVVLIQLARHFKFFRLGALYNALTLLSTTPSPQRLMPSSLTLGAILIYMLNALNYRPAEGRRETELTETCCWNVYQNEMDLDGVESDEDEDIVPVMLDFGLYFVSGIVLQNGTALRMGGGDMVSMESLRRLYAVPNEQDLLILFHTKTKSRRDPSQRKRKRTQDHQTAPLDVRLVVTREELTAQNTSLADLDIRPRALPHEAGPDIRLHQQDLMDQDGDVQEESIDDLVARIWRQFPYDIFEHAPMNRSNGQSRSHLLLSAEERREATIEVFRNTDLSQLFSRAVVKIVRLDKWYGQEFRRYFPQKGYVPPTRLQNFGRMRYFQEWNALMERLSSDESEVVRDSLWKIFKTFKWLPLTDSDRLWNTKKVKATRECIHLPHDDGKPAVLIGLNDTLVRDARRVRVREQSSDEEEST